MKDIHSDAGFFTESLADRDSEIFGAVSDELTRQRDEIELIADRLVDLRPVVAVDVAPQRGDAVEVFVAAGVVEPDALTAFDDERLLVAQAAVDPMCDRRAHKAARLAQRIVAGEALQPVAKLAAAGQLSCR